MKRHVLVLVIFTVVVACQTNVTAPAPPPNTSVVTPNDVVAPTIALKASSAPTNVAPAPDYTDPTLPLPQRVDALLAQMTLAEKIGQMTQIEHNSIRPEQVRQYALGSVLSGGGGLRDNSPATWRENVLKYENAARQTRLKIPLLYGLDAVHGNAHVAGATIFPHNIGLGATRDAALVERIGRATAEQLVATGVNWNFAPVVAVPQDVRWGRTYEGFSENTALVSELGAAYIKGLQSAPAPLAVLATPKHFLADGGTKFGTSKTVIQMPYLLDQGDAQMDEATLRALFLPPYQAALDAGAQTVMVSFSSWNGTKMHAQKYLLTDVLKGELGFEGFIVSDWQGIDQINPDYYQSVVTAINAGVDMSMEPYNAEKFIATLTRAVEQGDVPMARIDDAVRRILTVKFKMGLFEQPVKDADPATVLNNAAHRALAREAVRKSLVLLQNQNKTLPLDKNAPVIFVAGQGANSTGYTSGGWTLEWQGTTANVGAGMTIVDAVKQTILPQTRVEYNRFGNFDNFKDAQGNSLRANVGIVVLAEDPYAEGIGDRADLDLDNTAIQMLERVKQVSDRVVVILVSGRPRGIADALPLSDAFVAAWLPGTETQGITDVLFGAYEFTGKLPYTWQRRNAQLPFDFKNLKTEGCDAPLFPYGFGLTTQDASPEGMDCPN